MRAVGSEERLVWFSLGDMFFEYDEEKNQKDIEKYGVSFVTAARIFFDYDRFSELAEELAFTEKEREELNRARTLPITFDEDCPETTPEQALKFKRVNPVRRTAQ